MAANDRLGMKDREDGYGFGLSSSYGATTQGQMSKAVGDGFGAQKKTNTLSSYYSERVKTMMSGEEKTNMSSGYNSATGTGIDRTDGSNGHDNDPSGSGGFGDRESSAGGMGGV
jgi:hypothetical protein